MPHRHQEDQIYTVMAGVFYIGSGDQFDGDTVQAYPLGSVTVLPGNPSHFHWARSGEYVAQVTAIGPLILQYLDPGDDPRSGGAPWSRRRGMTETYMLAWDTMAGREKRWGAFLADPEWKATFTETEKDGPLVQNISSQLLAPTAFSSVNPIRVA